MNANFENKVVVVTGAGGTLCSEISIHMAKLGAKVVLVGRTEEKLQTVAEKIARLGGTAYTYACDVTDREGVAALARYVEENVGLCSCLVNGAGGNNAKAMPTITSYDPRELTGELPEGTRGLYDIDMDAFESVLNINTMGTVIPTMEFAKQMVKLGGGSVINFASMNSYCPLTRCFAYAMSKAAITNLTQSFAAYFAPANIRINAAKVQDNVMTLDTDYAYKTAELTFSAEPKSIVCDGKELAFTVENGVTKLSIPAKTTLTVTF